MSLASEGDLHKFDIGGLTPNEAHGAEPNEKDPPDFKPEGSEGFMHAEILAGEGTIVDGEKRDRTVLINSVREVLEKLRNSGPSGGKTARGRFLTDVCRIFKLPTTVGSADPVAEAQVLADLQHIPDEVTLPRGELLVSAKSRAIVPTDPKARELAPATEETDVTAEEFENGGDTA